MSTFEKCFNRDRQREEEQFEIAFDKAVEEMKKRDKADIVKHSEEFIKVYKKYFKEEKEKCPLYDSETYWA